MATEKQIREAIKDLIEATAASAVVVSRNILDLKNNKWLNFLISPADEKLHGWFITWEGGVTSEIRHAGAEIESAFGLFAAYEYRTGNDASNSEDEFNAEVEAVMTALTDRSAVSATIRDIESLTFRCYVSDEPGKNVHICEARVTYNNVLGC